MTRPWPPGAACARSLGRSPRYPRLMALKRLYMFEGDALPACVETTLFWAPSTPVHVRGLVWKGPAREDLVVTGVMVGREHVADGGLAITSFTSQADGSPALLSEARGLARLGVTVRVRNEGLLPATAHLEVWGEE
ncbi:MAG: hypothetical protein EOO70_04400 [Myxococcaceae bacterium]|nr:MAG: hypothetical protein EOO70_04400 [Myxococcaceae bacterium]